MIGQLGEQRARRALAAVAACLAAVPAGALAGKTVIAGHQSLKLTASTTPDRAGKAGVRFTLHADYVSLIPGQRLDAAEREIKLTLPSGMRLDPAAATSCPFAAISKAKGELSKVCPKSSVVGNGAITADARPAITTPVTGTVTLFNVRGAHHDLVLDVSTKYGTFWDLFIIRKVGARQILDAAFSAPPPGTNGLYTIKTIDLTFRNASSGKPYLTNPPKCPKGGWSTALLIANYGPEPTITASATIPCKSA